MLRPLVPAFLALLLCLSTSCDFRSPSEFEPPVWEVDLNIPLLHEEYGLANIIDSVTIHGSGDSVLIRFEGELPSNSIGEDYLQVPLALEMGSSSTSSPPNASSFFTGYQLPLTISVPVGDMMNALSSVIYDVSAFPLPVPIVIPADHDQVITSDAWNLVAATIEQALGDTGITADLYDSESIFSGVPFIESMEGIFIGGAGTDNYFQSSFTNVDLPMPVDTSHAFLVSGTDSLAIHTSGDISAGEDDDENTSLVGQRLSESIGVGLGFTLLRADDGTNVTIPANTDPRLDIALTLAISDLERARVVISEHALAPELDPILLGETGVGAAECQVTGIYGGTFNSPTGTGVNEISLTDVASSFPFSIDFGITFSNFLNPDSEALAFSTLLSRGALPYNQTQKLDGWLFANPVNADSALEEIFVDVYANTVPDTVDIYLDGTEPEWDFSLNVGITDLYFQTLQANIDCPFPAQYDTLPAPPGFTGASFGEVILEVTMYNQIRLPLFLDLGVIGVTDLGDSERVELNAELGIPEEVGDTAKTILRLDRWGTRVLAYTSMDDSTADSTFAEAGVGTSTIADVMRLNPSLLTVEAVAGIKGKGAIDVNVGIWGGYKVIAPFSIVMDPMTFMPENSTVLEEFPQSTRRQMRSTVSGINLTTRVVNGLPVGGELAILLSNLDLFPLSRETEILEAVRDSLGWPATHELQVVSSCLTLSPTNPDMFLWKTMTDTAECRDGTGYLVRVVPDAPDTVVAFVDTLMKVILPTPTAFVEVGDTSGIPGMVDVPGDTTFTSGLDSSQVLLLTGLGDHYVRNRTHFYGTEGEARFFSTRDTISISAFMTLSVSSEGLFESADERELILTYPNGGETLIVGEPKVIRWRSLGDGMEDVDVTAYTSLQTFPDPNREEDWFAVATGPNADSLEWTPTSETDSVWMKICTTDGAVCDQSGWFFTVASETPLVGRFTADRPRSGLVNKKGARRPKEPRPR